MLVSNLNKHSKLVSKRVFNVNKIRVNAWSASYSAQAYYKHDQHLTKQDQHQCRLDQRVKSRKRRNIQFKRKKFFILLTRSGPFLTKKWSKQIQLRSSFWPLLDLVNFWSNLTTFWPLCNYPC
jgi:hypothetical protein